MSLQASSESCPNHSTKTTEIVCHRFDDRGWDIVPSSHKRSWMDQTNGHAYKCLPLTTANQMGWEILCPSDFSAIWDGGNGLPNTKIIVEDEKFSGCILSHFGFGLITFQVPYLFKTSEDIGLFARGPTNAWIDNIHALDGFIETNWSNYSFTMNWKITKPNVLVNFKKGDPICMIMPYPIGIFDNIKVSTKHITETPDLAEAHKKWTKYRNDFNHTPHKNTEWQKDYFVGRKCPFSGNGPENKAKDHKTKYNLPRFDE